MGRFFTRPAPFAGSMRANRIAQRLLRHEYQANYARRFASAEITIETPLSTAPYGTKINRAGMNPVYVPAITNSAVAVSAAPDQRSVFCEALLWFILNCL